MRKLFRIAGLAIMVMSSLMMLLPPGGFVVMGLLLALGRLRRVVLARLFKPTRVVPAATATATAGGCHV